MTRADTLATPARIDQAAAQELIDAIEAYTAAAERMVLANGEDDEAVDTTNRECLTAQRRLEAAFVAATGWTVTFHPAEYGRRESEPVTARPSVPPYWTIA